MTDDLIHTPVLLREVIDGLNINPDGIYADCTCGFGGHSLRIAQRLKNGRLIAIDQDKQAIEYTKRRLSEISANITYVNDNFSNFESIMDKLEIDKIDGVLIDLGVSSFQLDEASRGFSYSADGPLDMRMSDANPLTAYTVVNEYPRQRLKEIITEYGEERFAPAIASAIVRNREQSPIATTQQLSEIIKSAIPPSNRESGHHPAKRTFQAIRIEVNNELNIIRPTINAIVNHLNKCGRIAVITFHSLEDRAVKQAFAAQTQGCTCPKDFPICVCNNKPKLTLVNKKPLAATPAELEENPRSRSAKLRCAERV